MSIVKLNNRGVRSATTFGSVTGLGSMTFIKKVTASSSATISFVDGTSDVVLDDTYKEYLFTFKDMHPETDNVNLTFQGNASGGSGYNETMTTTYFRAQHDEGDTNTAVGYQTSYDQAQGTSFQILSQGIGNANDECCSGYLHLFNPSSTTFVKHYISRFHNAHNNDFAMSGLSAGYFNTTSAIDEIQFKMSSGDIDAGDICLYGIN
tara:strand:- start:40 stop:660 length:621 start_codon:yes stop_codon:yes gene_type:complete